jgi:hypothetical protein
VTRNIIKQVAYERLYDAANVKESSEESWASGWNVRIEKCSGCAQDGLPSCVCT